MHRAVSMRLGPLPCPPRLLLRRLASESSTPAALLSACRRPLHHHRPQPPHQRSSAVNVRPSARQQARDICSTAPAWKGRRGGASALMPKRSGPLRRKVPGAGKKKKPKVHGAPMSRIHRDQRLEEDGKAQMEAMKAISPEDRARVQEMTEAFINTPLGAQNDSMNAFLRQKDPDAMMLNLGMRLSDDDHAIAAGGSGEANLPLSADGRSPSPLLHDGVDATTEAAAVAPEPPPRRDTLPLPSPKPLSSPSSRQPSGMYSRSPAPPTPPYPFSFPSPMGPYGGEAGMGLPRGGGGAADEFSFLVRTLGAHGRFEEARSRVIPEMRRRGVTPTEHTFASLLAGAATERDPIAAEQVWGEMVEGGIRPSAHAWCSRVNAHARAGRMRRALSLGREMREQGHPWDVATYTSLIAGSTRKRNYSGAWGLWNDMVIWGVEPDAMAYNTMMKLCADTRQYERAMLFLDDMDMEGLRPSRITIETLLKAAATAPQWIRVSKRLDQW
ncbi:unnamed protein product [Ectocarpus fasciculatus]